MPSPGSVVALTLSHEWAAVNPPAGPRERGMVLGPAQVGLLHLSWEQE